MALIYCGLVKWGENVWAEYIRFPLNGTIDGLEIPSLRGDDVGFGQTLSFDLSLAPLCIVGLLP